VSKPQHVRSCRFLKSRNHFVAAPKGEGKFAKTGPVQGPIRPCRNREMEPGEPVKGFEFVNKIVGR